MKLSSSLTLLTLSCCPAFMQASPAAAAATQAKPVVVPKMVLQRSPVLVAPPESDDGWVWPAAGAVALALMRRRFEQGLETP